MGWYNKIINHNSRITITLLILLFGVISFSPALLYGSDPRPSSDPPAKNLKYFGYERINHKANLVANYRPNIRGDEYIIMAGDILQLTVWGLVDFQYKLDVNTDGQVFIPNIGQIQVANMRLKKARKRIHYKLAQKYRGLQKSSPTIYMDLTINQFQSINIFIIGEVNHPGNYSINRYTSALDAINMAGGIPQSGSLRNINIIRKGKQIEQIDLYDYLLGKQQLGSIQLQKNDNLFVARRGQTVTIEGCVKHPSHYELKPGEGLQDLLKFAGGPSNQAYSGYIQIHRNQELPKGDSKAELQPQRPRIIDLDFSQVFAEKKCFELADGDRIEVFCSSKSPQNFAVVKGAVQHPDTSALDSFTTNVKELISHAGGLKAAAYQKRAEIYRTKNNQRELISIDLKQALEGNPKHNLPLENQDILQVFYENEINATYPVYITGAVKNPGQYELQDSMQVSDLLFKAGLYDKELQKQVYLKRADLIRTIEKKPYDTTITFDLHQALNAKGLSSEPLQPFDSLVVYPRKINQTRNNYIKILGSVNKPGKYAYTANMNLADALMTAHGFSAAAYYKNIEINRPIIHKNDSLKAQKYKAINVNLLNKHSQSEPHFGIADSLLALKTAQGFALQPGDIVRVKQDPQVPNAEYVTISGQVYFPGQYTILSRRENLFQLIKRAGGFTPEAYITGIELIRDNNALSADFNKILKYKDDLYQIFLKAGDSIHVPTKPYQIKVTGNVGSEGIVQFEEGRRLFYYINKRGGLKDHTNNIYILYPNREIHKVYNILGIYLCNPVIIDGSEILVTPAEKY